MHIAVYIGDKDHFRGAYPPDRPQKGDTSDFRRRMASAENNRGVKPNAGHVLELTPALARRYPRATAHYAQYILINPDGSQAQWQPRINKCLGTYDWLKSMGFGLRFDVVSCDLDRPHAPGSKSQKLPMGPEQIATARNLLSPYPHLTWYATAGGLRVIAPCATPITDPERFEGCVRRLAAFLTDIGFTSQNAGVDVDTATQDYCRLYKLPYVQRRSRVTQQWEDIPCGALHFATAPPIDLDPVARVHRRPLRRRPATAPPRFDTELSPRWSKDLKRLSAAMLNRYDGQRHAIGLALAGALLDRNVRPEQVPQILRAVATMAGWDAQHHEDSARHTVLTWRAGGPITALSTLRQLAPDLAHALDVFFLSSAELRLHDTTPPVEIISTTEAANRIRNAIRSAPMGPTVIQAPPGTGKTHVAVEETLSLASWREDQERVRRPVGTKSAFSFPSNELAAEQAGAMRSQGLRVKRRFGVLSVRRPDGSPECRFHAAALPLAEGGQSIPEAFCQGRGVSPCPHLDTCLAANGQDTAADSDVEIGTHVLLDQLSEFAGPSGRLFIDEPPELLQTQSFVLEHIDITLANLGSFETRYANAMRPAVQCVRAWLATASSPIEDRNLRLAMRLKSITEDASVRAFAEVGTDDPTAAAQLALRDPPKTRHRPPISPGRLERARTESPTIGQELGTASRVLAAVWRALQPDARVSTRVTVANERATLTVTAVHEPFERAVSRDGSVIIMDANADLHVPVIKRVLEAKSTGEIAEDIDARPMFPVLTGFACPDGAPIERRILFTARASRSAWLPQPARQLQVTDDLLALLERVASWLTADPSTRQVGLATFRPIALALRALQGVDVLDGWVGSGQDPKRLPDVTAALQSAIQGAPITHVRHYGSLRGLNDWRDLDAVVTLGDPFPDLEAVAHDAAFLGLSDADAQTRGERVARAELQQAAGRLRTVHRTRPGRLLHVGKLAPIGWVDGVNCTVEWSDKPLGGRVARVEVADAEHVRRAVGRVGGVGAAAVVCGVSADAMREWTRGRSRIPSEIWQILEPYDDM